MSELRREYQAPLAEWLTLERFEEVSGRTAQSIRGKIKRCELMEDIQYRRASDGRIMVNWREMDKY